MSQKQLYKVLTSFTDTKDNDTVYWADKDTYPRKGYKPTKERIDYLLSDQTSIGTPVIAPIQTEAIQPEEEVK